MGDSRDARLLGRRLQAKALSDPVKLAEALGLDLSRRDVLNGLIEDFRRWQFQDPATRKVPDLSGIFTPRYLLG